MRIKEVMCQDIIFDNGNEISVDYYTTFGERCWADLDEFCRVYNDDCDFNEANFYITPVVAGSKSIGFNFGDGVNELFVPCYAEESYSDLNIYYYNKSDRSLDDEIVLHNVVTE